MSNEPSVTKKQFPFILRLDIPTFRGSYRKGYDAYLMGKTLEDCPNDTLTEQSKKHFLHWKMGLDDAKRGMNRLANKQISKIKT